MNVCLLEPTKFYANKTDLSKSWTVHAFSSDNDLGKVKYEKAYEHLKNAQRSKPIFAIARRSADRVEINFNESGVKSITMPSVPYTIKIENPLYEPSRRMSFVFGVIIFTALLSGFIGGFTGGHISGILGMALIIFSTWESEKYIEEEII